MKLNKETVLKNSRSVKEGNNIFLENEVGQEMYVILNGEVEIYKKIRNAEKVLMTLKAGAMFGEMALVDKVLRSASARASKPTTLFVIHSNQLDQILISNADFSRKLVKILSQRLREANNTITDLISKDRSNHVFGALIQYGRLFGEDTHKGIKVNREDFKNWALHRIGLEKGDIQMCLEELLSSSIISQPTPDEILWDPKKDRRSSYPG